MFERSTFTSSEFDVEKFVDDVFHKVVSKRDSTPKDIFETATKAIEKVKKMHELEMRAIDENFMALRTVQKEQKDVIMHCVGNIEEVSAWVSTMQEQLGATCHDTVVTGSRLAECAEKIRRGEEILQLSSHFEAFMAIEPSMMERMLPSLSLAREELRRKMFESLETILLDISPDDFDLFAASPSIAEHPKEREWAVQQVLPEMFIKRRLIRDAAVWLAPLGGLIKEIDPDDPEIRKEVANGVRNIVAYRAWVQGELTLMFTQLMAEFAALVDPKDLISGAQTLESTESVPLVGRAYVVGLKQVVTTISCFSPEDQLLQRYLAASMYTVRTQREASHTIKMPTPGPLSQLETTITDVSNEIAWMFDFYVAIVRREHFLMSRAFGGGSVATVQWVSRLIEETLREEVEAVIEQTEAFQEASFSLIQQNPQDPFKDNKKKDVVTFHLAVLQAIVVHCGRFVTRVSKKDVLGGDGAENILAAMDVMLLPRRASYQKFQTELQLLKLSRTVCSTVQKDEDGNEDRVEIKFHKFMKDAESAVRRARVIATRDVLAEMCRDLTFEVLSCISSVAESILTKSQETLRSMAVPELSKKPVVSPAEQDLVGVRDEQRDLLSWLSWLQDAVWRYDTFFSAEVATALPQSLLSECTRRRTATFDALEGLMQKCLECLAHIMTTRALWILVVETKDKKCYQPAAPGSEYTHAAKCMCDFVKEQASALQSGLTLLGPSFMALFARGLLRGIIAHLKQMQVTDNGALVLKRDCSLFKEMAIALLGPQPTNPEGHVVLQQYDTLVELAGIFMVPLKSITTLTQQGHLRLLGANELQQWIKMRVDWKNLKV